MTVHAITASGEIRVLPVTDISAGDCRTIRIPKDADFTDIQSVVIDPYGEIAAQGDEGISSFPGVPAARTTACSSSIVPTAIS